MLELQSISKTFHPGTIHAKKALQNLSLSLNDGDFVTVIGGNGAGKSTLLNAIAGRKIRCHQTIQNHGHDHNGL